MVASKRVIGTAETVARAASVIAGLGVFAGIRAQEPARPAGAEVISLVCAPEEEAYLRAAINVFNSSYAQGRNPRNAPRLAVGEPPIRVVVRYESSGKVAGGLVNALRGIR